MALPIVLASVRLFVRLLLGGVLLSVGMSKLAHPRQFQRHIQDYQVLPLLWQSTRAFSMLLAVGIPLAEMLAGFGLISGFVLTPAILLALALFVVFSAAVMLNLVRGRRDLSCHCGGLIGDHLISWWLIGRNGVLVAALLVLLLTPSDSYTVAAFVRSPSLLNQFLVSTLVPVAVLAAAVVAAIALFNAARALWRS